MTVKKRIDRPRYSNLELAQYRLRKLALDLETGVVLKTKELSFLVTALRSIGDGADANDALGVKAARGQRKSSASAAASFRMESAIRWVASVMRPTSDTIRELNPNATPDELYELIVDAGEGLSLLDAIDRAADAFGYNSESLLTYWRSNPDWRTPTFSQPISSLPRRPK